jgi:hypothetical protein
VALRRWSRALARVLLALSVLGALVLAPLWFAPGWVLRRVLAYGRGHLPPGVTLEVGVLDGEGLATPRLTAVRLVVAQVASLRLRRVDLRLPVGPVVHEVSGLGEAGPLAASLRAQGLELELAAVGGLSVEVAAANLGVVAGQQASLELTGTRVRYQGAEVAEVDEAVAHAPWASLLRGRPLVTAHVGPARVDAVASRVLGAGFSPAQGESPETSGELPVRLERARIRDLAITSGEGGPALWIDEAEVWHEPGTPAWIPALTAVLRLEGGGTGRLSATPTEGGQRVAAEAELEDWDLARLPIRLPEDLAVAGALDADLSFDVSVEAPLDLARSQGSFTLRDARLTRADEVVVAGANLELSLTPERLRVEGRLGEVHPRRLRAWLPDPGVASLGERAAAELRLEAPLDLSVGNASLKWEGELAEVAGQVLRDAHLRGSWTRDEVTIESLGVGRVGGGRLRAEASVARDAAGIPTSVSARLEVQELPAVALGIPASVPTSSVALQLATTASREDPLALVAAGTLHLAGSGELPSLVVPISVSPEAMRVGPVAARVAGLGVEASMEVTRTARLRVDARSTRLRLPRLGPVEVALRGRVTAEPEVEARDGEAVLAHWVRVAAHLDRASQLGLRWHLAELSVTGEEGALVQLEEAVGGTLDPAEVVAQLDPIAVEVLDAQVDVDGAVGTRPEDQLRVALAGVPLARMVDLAVPEAQVSVQGEVGAELRLGALAGAPRAEGTLAWRGGPGVSVWRRQGAVIRRIGMAVPDQTWQLSLDRSSLIVDGDTLDVAVPVPPNRGAVRVELTSFPVQVQSKVFPERVEEVALAIATSLQAEVLPEDVLASQASLERASPAPTARPGSSSSAASPWARTSSMGSSLPASPWSGSRPWGSRTRRWRPSD